MNRERIIIRTSIIGIGVNVLLAAFKAVMGLLSHSVAIVLDAVNNLSDALSSLVTIIGAKLSGRQPDKKHPLGYGRIEYLTAIVISVLILYAGVTSLVESVKKIIHPETPDYAPVTLIIIAAAVTAKLLLGRFVKKTGESINSDSLVASGTDALFDSIISASTLVAALIYLQFHISLEAYLGVIISVIIIKAGLEQLRDTVSEILGERADANLARDVKASILAFPGVQGAYDLIIHNYGPQTLLGSIHVAVDDKMTVKELDALEHAITMEVYKKHQVYLTGISVYAVNTTDPHVRSLEDQVIKVLAKYPEAIQMHGFHVEEALKQIHFDIIISFDVKNRAEVYETILADIQSALPDYRISIDLDSDVSD